MKLEPMCKDTLVFSSSFGENRRITCVFPYPDDAVRHMLYTRLFNNGYGPADLSSEDAAKMFIYRGISSPVKLFVTRS